MKKDNSGQAMILATVMMGGVFLLSTAIAGILLFYELQQATDAGNSTIAIYAADAALEEATYAYFKDPFYVLIENKQTPCYPKPCVRQPISLANGATGVADLIIPPPSTPNAITYITATGKDAVRRTVRLLQTNFLVTPSR